MVVGATALVGDDLQVLDDAMIVLEDDRITYVGKRNEQMRPPEAFTIDATGKYAVPGLVDAHVHTNDGVGLVPLHLFLLAGVTSVRDLGNFTDVVKKLSNETASGAIAGPRIFYSGESFASTMVFSPFQRAFSSEDDARDAVRQRIEDGASVIKIVSDISPGMARSIAKEAHAAGMLVAADLIGNMQMDAFTALDVGVDTFEHMSGFPQAVRGPTAPELSLPAAALYGWLFADPARKESLARRLHEQHAFVVPTFVVLESMSLPADVALSAFDRAQHRSPEAGDFLSWYMGHAEPLRPAMAVHFFHACAYLPQLVANDVTIAAGSDTPTAAVLPGASLHRELALLQQCGMSPRDALIAGTINGGKILQRPDIGILEPGAVADLVIVHQNPLEDLRTLADPHLVVSHGAPIDLEGLRARKPEPGMLRDWKAPRPRGPSD